MKFYEYIQLNTYIWNNIFLNELFYKEIKSTLRISVPFLYRYIISYNSYIILYMYTNVY